MGQFQPMPSLCTPAYNLPSLPALQTMIPPLTTADWAKGAH